jgi:AraC-like DNA-binding protein
MGLKGCRLSKMSLHVFLTLLKPVGSVEAFPKIYLYQRMVRAKLFIDKNYASPIRLDTIKEQACFSTFHFIRLFRKIYGVTPHQHLITVRIERARALLLERKTVNAACHEVGFESITSFCSLFKKLTGTTPSGFLREHEQRLALIATNPLVFIPGCFADKNGWRKKGSFR